MVDRHIWREYSFIHYDSYQRRTDKGTHHTTPAGDVNKLSELFGIFQSNVPNSKGSRHPEPPDIVPWDNHHIPGLFCSDNIDICITLFLVDADCSLIVDKVHNDCHII